VRRQLSLACLLLAWLCANGVVWNAVQVIGWAKMFHDYSQVMPATQALQLTFSGEAPCNFCNLAESGREQTEQLPQQAALGGAMEKFLLVADCTPIVVIAAPDSAWPGVVDDAGLLRTEAVPVPPPRVA